MAPWPWRGRWTPLAAAAPLGLANPFPHTRFLSENNEKSLCKGPPRTGGRKIPNSIPHRWPQNFLTGFSKKPLRAFGSSYSPKKRYRVL